MTQDSYHTHHLYEKGLMFIRDTQKALACLCFHSYSHAICCKLLRYLTSLVDFKVNKHDTRSQNWSALNAPHTTSEPGKMFPILCTLNCKTSWSYRHSFLWGTLKFSLLIFLIPFVTVYICECDDRFRMTELSCCNQRIIIRMIS